MLNTDIMGVPFTAKAISSLDDCRIRGHGQSEHHAEGSLEREKTHVEIVWAAEYSSLIYS